MLGNAARAAHARTGIPASVTVAQAMLESDWGNSRLAREAHNHFGLKAIRATGYSTDPDYADKLLRILDTYSLDRLDR